MKRLKNTIFNQFVLCFLLLVIPVVIGGCVMIFWQKSRIEGETEKNIQAELYYGTKRLETQVESIQELSYYLMSDKDLRRFIYQYDMVPVYEYYSLITAVKERLNIFEAGNDSIGNVTVYFRDIGLSISKFDGVDRLEEQDYEKIADKVMASEDLLREEDGEMYFSHIFTYAHQYQYCEALVNVQLSREGIFKSVLNQSMKEDSVFFLYDHTSGRLLYDNGIPGKGFLELVMPYLDNPGDSWINTFTYEGKDYLVAARYSRLLDQTVCQCTLKENFYVSKTMEYIVLAVYLLLAAVLSVAFPYSVKKIVLVPIYRLVDAFRHLDEDYLPDELHYTATDEFNYLYHEFNCMVRRQRSLIEENYKSKLFAQSAEMKQLQAQINPHFMYNTYFILHRMILDEDLEGAERLSEYLGTYMEYITHNSEDYMTLERELNHVRIYLEIQKIRFEDRMRLLVEEIPEAYREIRVPRLTLQPIVENYLKYGYEVSESKGEIYIRFEAQEGGLSIIIGGGCVTVSPDVVRDLQRRLDEETDMVEVTGLINIHRRLKIAFGPESGVFLHLDEEDRLVTRLILQREESGAVSFGK